ncbi:hypothetical protein ABVK25_007627 [Lepraria finkii]|uniref:Uncharacterized protein n=1 Tax=Lepraria finkii TaxID=1340010 RepID=A0ABR4B3M7_9LECA
MASGMPDSSSKDFKKALHELYKNREIGDLNSYSRRYYDKNTQLRTGNPFKVRLSSMLRALEGSEDSGNLITRR